MSSLWKTEKADDTAKKAKTIAVLMNKGGTGKTETSLNLAYGLTKKGGKVLLIDFDPSSNLTSIVMDTDDAIMDEGAETFIALCEEEKNAGNVIPITGYNALTKMLKDSPKGIGEIINHNIDIQSVIHKTRFPNLDIIPSGNSLELSDMVLKANGDMKALRAALKPVEGDYDYIIIDCQPFQNTLTYNALCACYKKNDLVLCPVKINRGGLQGIQSTLQTVISWIDKEDLDYDVKILITMKNKNKVDEKWENALRIGFGDFVLKNAIRYQGKPITDASMNKKILLENPSTSVAQDYQRFVDEIYSLDSSAV